MDKERICMLRLFRDKFTSKKEKRFAREILLSEYIVSTYINISKIRAHYFLSVELYFFCYIGLYPPKTNLGEKKRGRMGKCFSFIVT